MTTAYPTCREIEPDLIAVATAEASPAAARRVESHVASCAECRRRARAVSRGGRRGVGATRRARAGAGSHPRPRRAREPARRPPQPSRALRRVRLARSGPSSSASPSTGVSVVEYLSSRAERRASSSRGGGAEAVEDRRADGGALPRARRLSRRTADPAGLAARPPPGAGSDFQRRVLEATARLPYGAVASYAGIAREIGAPRASRAVAQALRHNPLPIVVPCHRVIGSDGDLTGYAGNADRPQAAAARARGHSHGGRAQGVSRRAATPSTTGTSTRASTACPRAARIGAKPLGEFTLYASRARAEAVGLAPCTTCRPDLHRAPRLAPAEAASAPRFTPPSLRCLICEEAGDDIMDACTDVAHSVRRRTASPRRAGHRSCPRSLEWAPAITSAARAGDLTLTERRA